MLSVNYVLNKNNVKHKNKNILINLQEKLKVIIFNQNQFVKKKPMLWVPFLQMDHVENIIVLQD